MKKLLSLLLVLALAAAPVGCGSDNTSSNATSTPTNAAPTASGDVTTPADPTATSTPTEAPKERAKVSVAVLKGPTAIGMLKLMSDDEAETSANDYDFTVAGTADAIVGSVVKGDIPIAAVPCNLAATLWNKTNGGITVAAVNTLGVLYILDTGTSVQSVADLKGKTIY
ncbi:MAG: ABC transporter substrate-binding protein, partial [Lachnospiraceae bacterium]|nr:ABC transporter substrate-binding protein [Lachnospiraceae bacterium]